MAIRVQLDWVYTEVVEFDHPEGEQQGQGMEAQMGRAGEMPGRSGRAGENPAVSKLTALGKWNKMSHLAAKSWRAIDKRNQR